MAAIQDSDQSARGSGYAGDIPSSEAHDILRRDPNAVLVDVRTAPEWDYVGRPDLHALDREPVLISWKDWPDMQVRSQFVADVTAAGVRPDQTVLLLCRSGQRSRDAAIALTASGFTACFNISDGFEGPKDANGHRNTVAGWRAAGLPWVQG